MDSPPRLLGPLGVSEADELLYRSLLGRPESTLADLSRATGWDQPRLRRHLRSLESLGLATRTRTRPARYVPAGPEAAVEVLALLRQAEIERARLGAARLARDFRPGGVVGLVQGREAGGQRVLQAQQAARREVLFLDRPPHPVDPPDRHRALQRDLLARGVTCRTIYHQEAVATPAHLAAARDLSRRGEQGRMLAEVPMGLVIVDRRFALVAPAPRETLEVGPSALLDGLLLLFELLWQRAIPLWPGSSTLNRDDEHLLALAAAGLTDQAIARRLGVAQRTVERRMQRVMASLGARTRFQAGLRAAEQGLLQEPPTSAS